jgi:putative peptidoglycan lipid II flippase
MSILNKYRNCAQALSLEDRQIATSAIRVALFVLAAKVVAAGKEMAVAWRYGVGDLVDAYQVANTLMLWLPGTLGAAMTVVLIPLLVSLKDKTEDRHEFLAELRANSVLAGILMSGVALFLIPTLLPLVASGLSERAQGFVWDFCIGLLLPTALSLLITLNSVRLMAVQRQWNTLFEGLPALMILVFVLLWPEGGFVAPLLWGTLLGYVLQSLLISRLAARQAGGVPGFRFSFQSPQWVISRNFIGMMLLGQFLMSWVAPIDMAAAVQLGEGAVAQLGYAERLLSLLLSLGALAISRAVLPVFSTMAAEGNWQRLRDVSIRWGVLMFLMGLFVAALAWAFAPWGVRLLYERGAFSAEDTIKVVEVFRWGLTRLPFYFSGLIFFQLLASQRMFALIAFFAFTCGASKYFLNQFFAGSFGVSGINLATGVMYAWSTTALLMGGLWSIKKRIQ